MKDKTYLSTLVATIVSAVTFLLTSHFMGRQVNWPSAAAFIIVFVVVFEISRRLFRRRGE